MPEINMETVTRPYLYINDQKVLLGEVSPTTTLLRFLRDYLGLTGTKEGCAEGDCGACTVIAYEPQSDSNEQASYRALNSCLLLTPTLHGRRIYTVEGLVTRQRGGLGCGLGQESDAEAHPVQTALVERLGSQCGYCTPGVIMSMAEACYRTDISEPWQVDDQLCGNLCRCTGYRPIQEATEAVVGLRPSGPLLDRLERAESPDDLQGRQAKMTHHQQQQRFYRPTDLSTLWSMWAEDPRAELVAGGTDLGLRITKAFEVITSLISIDQVRELREVKMTDDGYWSIGAAVPLSDVERLAKDQAPALERMLRFFGARQIKNRGTLGGNLCTASPIGDTPPVLLALGARLRLASASGERLIAIDDFFIGYRQTALQPGELLIAIEVPPPSEVGETHQRAFKVSKRQELDISSISACMSLTLMEREVNGQQERYVREVRLAYGGMAATPLRAHQAEQALLNQAWTVETIEQAIKALDQDFTPITDHRASAWYRQQVAQNLLRGFWLEVSQGAPERLPYRPSSTLILSDTQDQGARS